MVVSPRWERPRLSHERYFGRRGACPAGDVAFGRGKTHRVRSHRAWSTETALPAPRRRLDEIRSLVTIGSIGFMGSTGFIRAMFSSDSLRVSFSAFFKSGSFRLDSI